MPRHRQSQYTLKEAQAILRDLGIVLTKNDQEYRVNFRGGWEATAGYESDIAGAVATGKAMAKNRAEWRCSCGSTEFEEGEDGWTRCAGCGRV